MAYTKSDLQLSDKSLFRAILSVGTALEKTNKELGARLLSNFNTYDANQLSKMMTNFQYLLVNSVCEGGNNTLDVDFLIQNKMAVLEAIIYDRIDCLDGSS